jgi:hypothetical protein
LGALGALALCACRIEVEDPDPDESFSGSSTGSWDERSAPSRGDTSTPPLRAEAPLPRAPAPPPVAAPAPGELPTQLYRELLVLDPTLLRGPLGSNASLDAPLSFRAQMAWLAGAAHDPFEFTRAWLSEWGSASAVGPELAPVTPRPGVRAVLLDSWVTASYDSSPDAGTSAAPRWADAPFQLIAVINRVDLATAACSGSAGELRYVYTAVDPQSDQALDMTAILEVPYPTTRPAADWARAWSELAALPASQLPAALARLAREVQLDADPLRVRLRSNEIALSDPASPSWELREFHLQIQAGGLALLAAPLEFTPRADVDPARLSEHVLAHAEAIRGGAVSLPEELRAGAATTASADFSWPVLGVSEGLRRAFSRETCNGCHGGDTATLPFQHLVADPELRRPARLSRFLYDPEANSDELRRRAARLKELAASECAAPAAGSGYFGP